QGNGRLVPCFSETGEPTKPACSQFWQRPRTHFRDLRIGKNRCSFCPYYESPYRSYGPGGGGGTGKEDRGLMKGKFGWSFWMSFSSAVTRSHPSRSARAT